MSQESKPVVVTGAMGQLGKRVTGLLLERGHTVVALDLRNDVTEAVAAELATRGRLVPAYVDLLDAAAVADLLAEHQPQAIVHLAAVVAPPAYRNPELARRVNVGGTQHLVDGSLALDEPPFLVLASSMGVYGSRNPHTHPERLTPQTPVNPIDCYGEDKVAAEKLIAASGLPHAFLRIGGIISTDRPGGENADYLVLMRATPRDNRIQAIDVRDAALAFANAVDRAPTIDGKVLLIGGNDTFSLTSRQLEDDLFEAFGIGRLGAEVGLAGDPADERGWGLTDWLDTTEAEDLLEFQEHDWSDTLAWVRAEQGAKRAVVRLLGPLIRPAMRTSLAIQRRREGRGRYADPWKLISQKYGDKVVAPTSW